MGGVTGTSLRFSEGDEQFAAPGLIVGSSGGVEEVERLVVVRHGLVVGELGEGPVTGPGRIVDRPVHVAGPGEVMGQLRKVGIEAAGMDRFDGRPGGPVELDGAGSGRGRPPGPNAPGRG